MDDLSNEMRPDKTVSPKMRAMLKKEKSEARRRIIQRGIVHFRADEQFMQALLDAADTLKTAPGTLCRTIVWKHLQEASAPSPESISSEVVWKVSESSHSADLATREDLASVVRELRQQLQEQHQLHDAMKKLVVKLSQRRSK